jgi:ABC-type Fe3+-hydroxamate transport system substrate-binding protein
MNPILIKQLDQALDITNAYTWEGTARLYYKEKTPHYHRLEVFGSSEIEHNGDIEGIKSQVYDLIGTSYTIDNAIYTIKDANIETTKDDENHNYINIKGQILLTEK